MTERRPSPIPYNHTASTADLIRWPAVTRALDPLLQAEGIELAAYLHCHLFKPRKEWHDLFRQGEESSAAPTPVGFEEANIWVYVDSYKIHIQNMHPLIPPKDLNDMVTAFLKHDEECELVLLLLVLALGSLCEWRTIRGLYDVRSNKILGYQYFEYATRLLQAGTARSEVNFIRAYILASLYCDQLGRVTESFRLIRLAGAETLDRLLP